LGHSSLGILGILDCCHNLGVVLIPEFCLLFHVLGEICGLVIVFCDCFDQLFDGSIVLSNLLLEHVDLLILVLFGFRALFHLHVAPVLVVIFVLLLRHQPEDHFLNHLLNLIKWAIISADLLSQFLQCF
jgi:hypothetical protein